jgi:hypothetical protein
METYVEIKVLDIQSIKSLLKTLGDIRMVGIPELAGKKDLLARDSTVLDSQTDLVLVSCGRCQSS